MRPSERMHFSTDLDDKKPTHFTDAEILLLSPGLRLERSGRYFLASFLEPHRVLSTCTVNGGFRNDLRFLLNHQSCEGKDHHERHTLISGIGMDGYHNQVCAETALPAGGVAMMGTAANMNYASAVTIQDEGTPLTESASTDFNGGVLAVTAVVTAGVQGNATCAGDPATWRETASGWEKTKPLEGLSITPNPMEGTINTMLVVNHPLTDGALARAVVTMTEAKSAALTRLAVGSRYSPDAATGTGTDQFCIAAQLTQAKPLSSTSQHVRLGEMIGVAVRDATLEALRWQNGLEASYTRGLFHALGRFGVKECALLEALRERLEERPLSLLRNNEKSVFYEPMLGAAAYAMAAILDRVRYQTIPPGLASEALRQQAASMACSLAALPDQWPRFHAELRGVDTSRPATLVAEAIALGWKAKWS